MEAAQAIREVDLGIERLYQEDEVHYVYGIPDAERSPAAEDANGLVWVYDGQQVFADQHEPEGFGDLGGVDESLLDFEVDPTGYFGVGTSVRVDEYGRRWVLADADAAEVVGAISTYDEALRRRFGSEPEGRYGDTSPEVAAPDDLLIQYQSLITHDCNSDSVIDYTTSSGSTWAKVTGILITETTRTEVFVMTDTATCSGVMLNDVTVLTAAHCAADVNGPFDPNEFIVCTRGNLQTGAACKVVTGVNPRYGSYSEAASLIDHDVALLELAAHPANTGSMGITNAVDSVLDDYPQYLLGNPSWAGPSCTYNLVAPGFGSPVVVGGYAGAYQWNSVGTLVGYDSTYNYLQFDISSGRGESGGPLYYCPSGNCDAGGAYVTAVNSARLYGGDGDAVGARARDFRTWAIANLY